MQDAPKISTFEVREKERLKLIHKNVISLMMVFIVNNKIQTALRLEFAPSEMYENIAGLKEKFIVYLRKQKHILPQYIVYSSDGIFEPDPQVTIWKKAHRELFPLTVEEYMWQQFREKNRRKGLSYERFIQLREEIRNVRKHAKEPKVYS